MYRSCSAWDLSVAGQGEMMWRVGRAGSGPSRRHLWSMRSVEQAVGKILCSQLVSHASFLCSSEVGGVGKKVEETRQMGPCHSLCGSQL